MTSQSVKTTFQKYQTTNQNPNMQPANWSGVIAMTVCAFVMISSEFLPVSLLTPIAADFQVSEGAVGQGLTISGVLAVITALTISALAGTLNRKWLLLGLSALMCVSGAIIGLAPNYWTYMLGRALIGVAVGGFWSMSAATAMRLVPPADVPRALAIFNGGNALAMVIAAPMGSYLGELFGWKGAFLALVPLAIIALIWQGRTLPNMSPTGRAGRLGDLFGLLRHPVVVIGFLAVAFCFMGQYSLYTYIRGYLENVTGLDGHGVSWMLLLLGGAGVVGTMLIGRLLRHTLFATMVVFNLLLALTALGFVGFGHVLVLVTLLVAVWGLLATSAPVGWWTWVTRAMPNHSEAGGGLMVAVCQLSIALGSTIGGVLYDHQGYKVTFTTSAVFFALAALMVVLCSRRNDPSL